MQRKVNHEGLGCMIWVKKGREGAITGSVILDLSVAYGDRITGHMDYRPYDAYRWL